MEVTSEWTVSIKVKTVDDNDEVQTGTWKLGPSGKVLLGAVKLVALIAILLIIAKPVVIME
jgi:hypothetical protein